MFVKQFIKKYVSNEQREEEAEGQLEDLLQEAYEQGFEKALKDASEMVKGTAKEIRNIRKGRTKIRREPSIKGKIWDTGITD